VDRAADRSVDRIANPGPWFTDFTDKAGGGAA
jgi:hypothetical protein